jgi:hypothetical protein
VCGDVLPDRRRRKAATTLSRREWDRFIADRRAGRIAPKGMPHGKPVGARVVAHDLITLRAVLNWATMVGDGDGRMLLDRNPLKGLPLPRNESPARRVLTTEQYVALLSAAASFDNPRVRVFLVLPHETEHRAASIRQLRWSDIDLERRVVCWRADADKIGYRHTGADNVAHLPVRGDTSSTAVKEQIRLLAAKHIVVDQTVSWNELLSRARESSLTSFQPGFAEAPWPLRASYGSVRNAADSATASRALRSQLAAIKAMHDAGVRIVAGTDYGLPGFSLLRELELYVEAGLSPLDAIRAATAVPADVMGLSDESGTIEVGKRADLVVLDRDPLIDIHNVRVGRWVVVGSVMFAMVALRRAVHFSR